MDAAQDFHDQYCHTMLSFDEEDQEFLRNILQQPGLDGDNHLSSSQSETENKSFPTADFSTDSSGNADSMVKNHQISPEAYILSFDPSNVLPPSAEAAVSNQEESSTLKRCSSKRISSTSHNVQLRKKSRSRSETVDHIMAERRRRQQLTERFIALSATIPGLKKMDKATILEEAIKYVKRLQERVTELEKQNKKNINREIWIKKCELHKNDYLYEGNEVLPEIDARVSENQVLLGIHCEKQEGIEFKILALLKSFHLCVTSISILPFGNCTLGITIIAQMGEEYRMTMTDVMNNLRQGLSKSHEVDPY